MLLLSLSLAKAAEGASFAEAFIPWIPAISGVAFIVVTGAFGIWNRRRGAVETRAPDVNEMWNETEKARRARRFFEDLFYDVRNAFVSYVTRVQNGGSTELTEKEQKALDADSGFDDRK